MVGIVSKKALDKLMLSPNGPMMIKTTYVFIRHTLPALFQNTCPYHNRDKLYLHAIGCDERIMAFSTFCLLGFDIERPDIQSGHYSMYVSPKTYQYRKFIDYVEKTFSFDTVSELIAESNNPLIKAQDTSVIIQYLEHKQK